MSVDQFSALNLPIDVINTLSFLIAVLIYTGNESLMRIPKQNCYGWTIIYFSVGEDHVGVLHKAGMPHPVYRIYIYPTNADNFTLCT